MKFILHFVLALFCYMTMLGSLTSCDKEPETITLTQVDTLIIIDTLTLTDTLTLMDTLTLTDTIFQSFEDTATTFILVRHAETSGSGSNPNLSVDGQTRANRLSQILDKVNLNAVYSTNFNRTMQTAQPAATSKGLSIATYDPFAPGVLIDQVLASFPGGYVLVVGHSNTIPDMLNEMVGADLYPDIGESEFDNFFVVHVSIHGVARVTHLKY